MQVIHIMPTPNPNLVIIGKNSIVNNNNNTVNKHSK